VTDVVGDRSTQSGDESTWAWLTERLDSLRAALSYDESADGDVLGITGAGRVELRVEEDGFAVSVGDQWHFRPDELGPHGVDARERIVGFLVRIGMFGVIRTRWPRRVLVPHRIEDLRRLERRGGTVAFRLWSPSIAEGRVPDLTGWPAEGIVGRIGRTHLCGRWVWAEPFLEVRSSVVVAYVVYVDLGSDRPGPISVWVDGYEVLAEATVGDLDPSYLDQLTMVLDIEWSSDPVLVERVIRDAFAPSL
jgi:hypothetical protein